MFYDVSKIVWFVGTPSNLCALVIGLGLWLSARRHRGAAPVTGLGLAALLLLGLGPFWAWTTLPLENRFPPFVDDGRRVDGIVVLGGSVYPKVSMARGELNVGDSAERILALGDLARRYPQARLVFSGGVGPLMAIDELPEAEVVARFAGALGITPGRIMIEGRSRTTWENAVDSRALVDPKPDERWLLVTSAWHMPRAVGSFRQAGFPVVAYPVDYQTRGLADMSAFQSAIPIGLQRFDQAVKEWVGLAAYRVSGRSRSLFPAPPPGTPIR